MYNIYRYSMSSLNILFFYLKTRFACCFSQALNMCMSNLHKHIYHYSADSGIFPALSNEKSVESALTVI